MSRILFYIRAILVPLVLCVFMFFSQVSKVTAVISDPCKVCIGSICSTVASPPHCATQYNECSNNSMCGGINPYCSPVIKPYCMCGCEETVNGGYCNSCPTTTPPPTSTPTPTGTSCGQLEGTIQLLQCGTCGDGCKTNYINCTYRLTNSTSICTFSRCVLSQTCMGADDCGSCDEKNNVDFSSHTCGSNGCAQCYRPMSRTVCISTGETCDVQCVYDESCGSCGGDGGGGVTPGACTVTLLPDEQTVALGSSHELTASINVTSGNIISASFLSNNSSIVSVNPTTDSAASYSTNVSGNSIGVAEIGVSVNMNDGGSCTSTATVIVGTPNAWWQVVNADVYSGSTLYSYIPGTCNLPTCNPVFGLNGPGGYPGVSVYVTDYDFQSGSGLGSAGEPPNSWIANSLYQGKTVDYSYFSSKIPSSLVPEEITSPIVNGSLFESGGTSYGGYYYYHFNGSELSSLTINGDISIAGDRKVVILSESSNVNLNGNVEILSPGNGFFMLIVGRDINGTSGFIFIDGSVTNLDGVFFAESEISTGEGNTQFTLNGSMVANTGISLERDLDDNSVTPAEVFNYSPEIVQLFPNIFKQTRMRWKEVVP